MAQVSIIIPTLNEASSLGNVLQHLSVLNPSPWEVIVVDGNSDDETVAIAKTHNAKVITVAERGRSIQQNRGADFATGDILCFLHADTFVPNDLVAVITQTLTEPDVVGGGFISLMIGSQSTRWGISLHNFLKTYYAPLIFRPHLFIRGLRILFGDQVIFCRRSSFIQCGGFDNQLPILEDGELWFRLMRYGHIRQVNRIVQSSDRRVEKWGAWKATAIYMAIGYGWMVGIPAATLKQLYEDIR